MKYRSTINGGIALCRATNLVGAVTPMRSELAKGNDTYLRETQGNGVVVRFRPKSTNNPGTFIVEAHATNLVGATTELPDWGAKALRILEQ